MIVVTSYGKKFTLAPIEGRTLLSLVNDSVRIPDLDGIPFQCQAGTCKRCVVYVESGQEFLQQPNEVEQRALGPRLHRGFRLACQTLACNQKKYLRKEIIRKRSQLNEEQRVEMDHAILEHCMHLEAIRKADVVMAYMSFRDEVATRPLIEALWNAGKTVMVPIVDKELRRITPVTIQSFADLHISSFGIPEPSLLEEYRSDDYIKDCAKHIQAVIVPGVAFRTDGGRLGYGAGYYDKFLSMLAPEVATIGLAYPLQIQETLPVEEHDVCLQWIVTSKKVYKAKSL